MTCRWVAFTTAMLALFFRASILFAAADQNTNPDFGANVLVFDPSTPDMQAKIDSAFGTQERGEFSDHRFAFLFKPGAYDLDVKVGFYTQVAGLGARPDDVSISGAVRSNATWHHGNATVNFWRCVENLSVTPGGVGNVDVWAVSQGTALRRVHVKGNLNLSDHGWSSGGFLADCVIDGQVDSGTQQQWLSRNSRWGSWKGGSWNMVFVGVPDAPQGEWPEKSYTVIEQTPVVREKPFLMVDDAGRFGVMVPPLENRGTSGISWQTDSAPGGFVPLDRFYLAHADRDNAASINAALDAGKNLLLTPGIYHLEDSLRVTRAGTIVLGLGYPTLIPESGTPAMTVGDVDGVEVGGILFQAGQAESQVLLEVGTEGSHISHADNPTFLFDIFGRAGGAAAGSTGSMVTIHSSNVVGDNSWLWRADHGHGVGWDTNRVRNGLIVDGDDVTFYGLFVEHCQGYQTLWNGNGGRVYFYQSELPYDPPSQAAWQHDGVGGFASYKVGPGVTSHEAWGLGVYCVFYAAPVVAEAAIETPANSEVRMHHMITLRLGGQQGSGIRHILNGEGASVITTKTARLN